MGRLIILEYDARAGGVRQALLREVEVLALAYGGRLRFVATERDAGSGVVREVMAVDLASGVDADALVARWRADLAFPTGVAIRRLALEEVRATEPVEPLFP
ncbi:hypothetical protein FQV39_07205 [Bosea sp. F3-2]|uniref:hypothetical protein n=1 Tax=Bosea sp. F3-2 TaxID=2599640 RepID=UPI0011EED329|nr:hypothetical protein [Bosea sp. F3-2]QEL22374.1 hypothetical protein FQV39_07205 [Bosea sp. F3-2]